MTKRKSITTTIYIIGSAAAAVLIIFVVLNALRTITKSARAESLQMSSGTVQVLETISDTAESSYLVGAALPCSDFSSIGRILEDRIARKWNIYNSMTREQKLFSSRLWGNVDIQTDTWNECEETIGFTVFNPLEAFDWLDKTGYFGMESTDPNIPAAHVQVIAETAKSADGKPNGINITAGYGSGNVRVTITAALSADSGTFTTGSVCNGYASYKQYTVTSASGIPVLVVITDEMNNTGYYNADYFNPAAYWVKDNVFYSLYVLGEAKAQAEIQAVLDRIIREI